MKFVWLSFFVLFIGVIYGQSVDYYNYYDDTFEHTQQTKAYHYIYNPPLNIKPTLKEKAKIDLDYPEQLMHSIVSATDYNWVKYNTYSSDRELMYKPPSYFKEKRTWHPDKNYLSLTSKLQFEMDGVEYVLMRFRAYSEGDDHHPVGVYTFRKTKRRWYDAPNALPHTVLFTMLYFKIDLLEAVLMGEKNGNVHMDELISQAHGKNGINLMLLGDIVQSWSHPDTEDKDKKAYFFDKIDWR